LAIGAAGLDTVRRRRTRLVLSCVRHSLPFACHYSADEAIAREADATIDSPDAFVQRICDRTCTSIVCEGGGSRVCLVCDLHACRPAR
jgi:hypothetical protein